MGELLEWYLEVRAAWRECFGLENESFKTAKTLASFLLSLQCLEQQVTPSAWMPEREVWNCVVWEGYSEREGKKNNAEMDNQRNKVSGKTSQRRSCLNWDFQDAQVSPGQNGRSRKGVPGRVRGWESKECNTFAQLKGEVPTLQTVGSWCLAREWIWRGYQGMDYERPCSGTFSTIVGSGAKWFNFHLKSFYLQCGEELEEGHHRETTQKAVTVTH